MVQATVGIQFNEEEQKIFDTWSKEAIYEAYILEKRAKEQLNIELNQTNRRLAEIKYMASK